MCVQSAAKAVQLLAIGLRGSFTSIAKSLFGAMILKLKENKQSVVNSIQEVKVMPLYRSDTDCLARPCKLCTCTALSCQM